MVELPHDIVRLEGGPRDFPEGLRMGRTSAGEMKVKIEHRGGYEHFERTDANNLPAEDEPIVFRWIGRTRIAE